MNDKILNDNFLKGVTSELKNEVIKFIYDGYSKRINLKMNQKEYSDYVGLKLSTLKRIELGKCYDLKLISQYTKN